MNSSIHKPTKSEIFSVYNKVKAFARKNPDLIDPKRVDKALGILQSNAYFVDSREEYNPTTNNCGCKDWEFFYASRRCYVNGQEKGKYAGPCKHMIAELLIAKIQDQREELEVSFLLDRDNVLESSYR